MGLGPPSIEPAKLGHFKVFQASASWSSPRLHPTWPLSTARMPMKPALQTLSATRGSQTRGELGSATIILFYWLLTYNLTLSRAWENHKVFVWPLYMCSLNSQLILNKSVQYFSISFSVVGSFRYGVNDCISCEHSFTSCARFRMATGSWWVKLESVLSPTQACRQLWPVHAFLWPYPGDGFLGAKNILLSHSIRFFGQVQIPSKAKFLFTGGKTAAGLQLTIFFAIIMIF